MSPLHIVFQLQSKEASCCHGKDVDGKSEGLTEDVLQHRVGHAKDGQPHDNTADYLAVRATSCFWMAGSRVHLQYLHQY